MLTPEQSKIAGKKWLEAVRKTAFDEAFDYYRWAIKHALGRGENSAVFFTCDDKEILEERKIAIGKIGLELKAVGWNVLTAVDSFSIRIYWQAKPFTWWQKLWA